MKRFCNFLVLGLFLFPQLAYSQNIGINVTNPESDLHIKSDSTKVEIRMDSEIPVDGLKYGSTVLTPSAVATSSSTYCGALCTGWINADVATLQNLDGSSMELNTAGGPILVTDGLTIFFQSNANLPTGTIIEGLTFQIDYEIVETDPGQDFGTAAQAPTYTPGAMSSVQLPTVNFSNNSSQPSLLSDGGLSLPANVLQTGIAFSIDYLVNIDPAIQGNLKIDRIRMKIDYNYPALVPETTSWKMNVEEGKFLIQNNDTPHLSISENGELNIAKIKMVPNSANGSVLTSNKNGIGTWQSLPTNSDLDWRRIDDTLTSLPFPIKVSKSAVFEQNIQVGHTEDTAEGTIRFNKNTKAFEGFNGSKWLSLTATNTGWGSKEGTEQQAFSSTDSLLGASLDISGTHAIVRSDTSIYFYELDVVTEEWSEISNFTFEDPVYDVAVDGDNAIVTYGVNKIEFYQYDCNIWILLDDTIGLANFGGYAVDIKGIRAMAVMNENSSAYVYILSGSNWILEDQFDIPFPYSGGSSCSLRPAKLIIGKPQKETSLHGKVYYYERSGSSWTQAGTISHPSPYGFYPFGTGSQFGSSVSLVQDYAVFGSKNDDNYKGAAYYYKYIDGVWQFQQKIVPDNSQQFDRFGAGLSLSDSYQYLAIGSPGYLNLNSSSSVYTYEMVNGEFQKLAELQPSDTEDFSDFGEDVSITTNALFIGAKSFGSTNEGKFYFYKNH